MPSFRGGQKALMAYLAENVQYPKDMKDTCAQGRVLVSFVVERDGSITEPKVVRSVCQALDKEALRVVNAMPKWMPGKQNGNAVRVKYVLPITFRLKWGLQDRQIYLLVETAFGATDGLFRTAEGTGLLVVVFAVILHDAEEGLLRCQGWRCFV